MFRTTLLVTFATIPVLASPMLAAQAAIPSSLPETQALDVKLAHLSSESQQMSEIVQQWIQEVRSTRTEVERGIEVTTSIRRMDTRLNRLVSQLRPYESIPKIRTVVQILSRNLNQLNSAIHNVRSRTDALERQALKPTAERLMQFERNLQATNNDIVTLALQADQSRANLARIASYADSQLEARDVLEKGARNGEPTVQSLVNILANVNGNANELNNSLSSLKRSFASFSTVRSSLAHLDRSLQTPERSINNLDRAMSRQLSIRIPLTRRTYSITIRQLLEAPGNVLGIVLRPLEAMAFAILDPILAQFRVQIPPPNGLDALVNSLNGISSAHGNLNRSINAIEGRLNNVLNQNIAHFNQISRQYPLDGSFN